MKCEFNKTELTTIYQVLKNELKITTETDEKDFESEKWVEHLEELIDKVEKKL